MESNPNNPLNSQSESNQEVSGTEEENCPEEGEENFVYNELKKMLRSYAYKYLDKFRIYDFLKYDTENKIGANAEQIKPLFNMTRVNYFQMIEEKIDEVLKKYDLYNKLDDLSEAKAMDEVFDKLRLTLEDYENLLLNTQLNDTENVPLLLFLTKYLKEKNEKLDEKMEEKKKRFAELQIEVNSEVDALFSGEEEKDKK